MKPRVVVHFSLIFAAIVIESACSAVPSHRAVNFSILTFATEPSSTQFNTSRQNRRLWQPLSKVEAAFKKGFARATKLFQKEANDAVSVHDTESVAEHSIQMGYLNFVEKMQDNSSWSERLLREVRSTYKSLLTVFPKLSSMKNFVGNRTEGELRELDSTNSTVRTEVTTNSETGPMGLSSNQESFKQMPANAEDIIRGFKSQEDEVVKVEDIKAEEQSTSHEIDHSEEEDDDSEEEEEETSRESRASPDLYGKINTVQTMMQGLPRPGDGQHEGQISSHHREGAVNSFAGSAGDLITQNRNEVDAPHGLPRDIHHARSPETPAQVQYQPEASMLKNKKSSSDLGDNELSEKRAVQGGSQENIEARDEEEGENEAEREMTPDQHSSVDTGRVEEDQVLQSRGYNGNTQGVVNGQNLTQLSLMAYKIAKTEKVFSMAAAPCREVSLWMPEVVRRLELELPGFQFYCVDTAEQAGSKDDLKKAFGDVSGGFLQSAPEEIEQVVPKNLDLVVSWMGMQQWGIRKSWRFIKGLRRSGARMALFSNNPLSGNSDPGSQTINIRKSPLLLNEPQRVIGKVSSDENMQLLLYSMDGLRDGF